MQNSLKGVWIAGLVVTLWVVSLVLLLSSDVWPTRPFLMPLAIAWQTFLYTGIFITAHDAIHGSILPGRHRFNAIIGAVLLFGYALFPYAKVRAKHFEHHRFPASDKDPDYHDGKHPGFWRWYCHFLFTYITPWQILGMALLFNILLHALGIPIIRLFAFWVIPALLSTLQLFYFGTYLPHKEPQGGYDNPHRARSNNFSVWWSFWSCYHFGYHWEHHQYPGTPWWRLPQKRFASQRTD